MKKSFRRITSALVAMAAATAVVSAPLTTIGAAFELSDVNVVTNLVTADEEHVYESYIYTIGSNGINIKSYHGEETDVVIPSEIDGKAVISINNSAFAKNTSIVSVTIPASIKTIGISAFSGCSNLEKVTLSEGLVSLGERSFGNTKISSIYIPASLNEVSIYDRVGVFENCASLNDVTFGEGITSIPRYLFADCPGLKKITIPDTITSIKENSFRDCANLTDIDFSTSVKTIGDSAFTNCTSLAEVEIPANIETIGIKAFQKCTKLEKVTLNEGLVSLGERSFGDTKISSIYIPASLNEVTLYDRVGVFENCASLNDVTFSKKPAIIPEYLFEGCTGLKEITIPGNIYKIKNNAFNDCSALEKITILNPYNGIIDDKSTIAPKASICGYDDSSAHVYAVKYERNFVSLGPIPPSYLGDVNKDETVDSTDASLILAEYALLSTNGTPTFDDDQNKRADVNADGCIDSMDASYILQYYAFVSTVGPLRSDDYFYGIFNS